MISIRTFPVWASGYDGTYIVLAKKVVKSARMGRDGVLEPTTLASLRLKGSRNERKAI